MTARHSLNSFAGVLLAILPCLLTACARERTLTISGGLPVEWYRAADRPCIEPGGREAFDAQHVDAPAVMYSDDCYNLRMFYCGAGAGEHPVYRIGIADRPTLADENAWKKHPGNPILDFGDNRTSLVCPTLLRGEDGRTLIEDNTLRMYVVAVDLSSDAPVGKLYRTTSTDGGLQWSPLEGPLMDNIYSMSVLKIGDEYRMWYVDTSNGKWVVRYALSTDGIDWVPGYSQPVLEIDQGWEKGRLAFPFVIHDSGEFLMWYSATTTESGDKAAIGLAISGDGIHWEKFGHNPIIAPDESREFETNQCTGQYVLPNITPSTEDERIRDGYRIWYTACDRNWQQHRGIAIAAAVTQSAATETKEPAVPRPSFTTSATAPVDPRFQPLHFLERYGQETEPRYEFNATTREQWQRWHRNFRREFKDVLGMPEVQDWTLRVTPGEEAQCNGYKRMAFTIETAPGLFVPAYLLVPDGLTDARPAILCSHGHGIGMNGLVGLKEDGGERQFGQGYQHDFGIQAVRAGYVTLVFDQMGFGRRRDFEFNKQFNLGNACEHPSKTAVHWGMSMSGIRVYDAMRMIDFLQTRPEVDPKRIGMVGISGGGLVTQFTAAIDDRIKAACVSGYCNRFESCILGLRHCIDNYVPGLGLIGNNDDIACLIAPRPLLIESGIEDPIFPIDATRAALRKLKRCYSLLDVGDRLEADLFEADHQFSGAKTWDFFRKYLGDPAK